MKFDKRDYRVLSLLLLIAIIFTGLFFYDLNKRMGIGDREVVGSIQFKKNVVQRKFQDQVIWETLENHSPLTNKDTIRSEAYSDALIKLKDGTEINIGENSMFSLDLSGEKPSIEFSQGSMQVKNSESKSSSLVIKSQGSQIDVGSGDVKIEKEAKKKLSLYVEKGISKITHNGKETNVESGRKAEFSGKELTLKKVPVRLGSPAAQKMFLFEGSEARVSFDWTLDPGFFESQLEVSRSPIFKLQLIKKSVDGKQYSATLKEGTYYWRVKTKDPKTGKLESSDINKFFVTKDEPFRLESPSNGVEITYVASLPLVDFSWPRISTTRVYKFELADSLQFTRLIKTVDTEANAVSFDDLKEGNYFWRVTAVSSFPSSPNKKAGPRSFSIKMKNSYSAPRIIRPVNGSDISLEKIGKGQAIIIWEGNPELTKFKIEISKDSKFSSSIFTKEITSNFITPNWKDFGKGMLFVRVKGFASNGTAGEISSTSKFIIIDKKSPTADEKEEPSEKAEIEKEGKTVSIKLVSPINQVVQMKGKKNIDFLWKGGSDSEKYDFTLYQNSGQKQTAIYRTRTKSKTVSVIDLTILDEGNFSWEISQHRGGRLIQSRKGNFTIALNQLKTLKSTDIEFISPTRLYREGKHK